MTVTHQPPDPPSQVSTRRPTPTSDSTEALNTPVQRFVADWLKTHDYPLEYEINSDGIATIRMTAKSELIEDLYATREASVFRATLVRAVTATLDHIAKGPHCPTDDMEEVLRLWVIARLPAPQEQLVGVLLDRIFTMRTAEEALSRSALSTGLLYTILDYDEEPISWQAAFASLQSEGLICETGEYRDGVP